MRPPRPTIWSVHSLHMHRCLHGSSTTFFSRSMHTTHNTAADLGLTVGSTNSVYEPVNMRTTPTVRMYVVRPAPVHCERSCQTHLLTNPMSTIQCVATRRNKPKTADCRSPNPMAHRVQRVIMVCAHKQKHDSVRRWEMRTTYQ